MQMKKVLIITYYWPPSGGAGVQRWLKFVKYLRNFGWEPIVFTPENPEPPSLDESLLQDVPEGIQVLKNKIWEPYSFYKKLSGKKSDDKIQAGFLKEDNSTPGIIEKIAIWVRGNLFIPDARKFWIKPSVRKLAGYLKKNPVDLMVTTGPPHSAHLIGLKLKEKTAIPWLTDFRDPWTNIDFYHKLMLSKRADRINHHLEKKVLNRADGVIVISNGMRDDFSSILKRDYFVIPNGYDEDDVTVETNLEPYTKKFVIAHIGSMNKDRNPVNLWKALGLLVKEDREFAEYLQIKNVGKLDFTAIETLKRYGLEEYLEKVSYMSHKEVIKEQQSASVLLLLVNRTPNARLIVTGKIFEYLISGRPIVCIAPTDGDAAYIINETNCGKVFDFDEVERLKQHLKFSFEQFKKGVLKPVCRNVEQYNRKVLTEKMAGLFDKIS